MQEHREEVPRSLLSIKEARCLKFRQHWYSHYYVMKNSFNSIKHSNRIPKGTCYYLSEGIFYHLTFALRKDSSGSFGDRVNLH